MVCQHKSVGKQIKKRQKICGKNRRFKFKLCVNFGQKAVQIFGYHDIINGQKDVQIHAECCKNSVWLREDEDGQVLPCGPSRQEGNL